MTRCTTFARKTIGKVNYKKKPPSAVLIRTTEKFTVSTQEDRLVWEAEIQALRRKEGSRAVGLMLRLRLGLVSGIRVNPRARVRVGINGVAAVVEFLVLVIFAYGCHLHRKCCVQALLYAET